METTTLDHIDKVIEQHQLPEVTLSLILGKNIDHGRGAGIFTPYDLNKIKSYIDKVLKLPYQKDTIIELLGYEDINIPQISAETIQTLFLNMRTHAFGWHKIEYAVKQQAIDLEITGREITSTGEQLLAFINKMPLIKKINKKIEDVTPEELELITYSTQDKKVSKQLITILESMKNDIDEQYNKTLKIKNMIYDFRINIVGGENSKGEVCNSLYYDVLKKKKYLSDFFNNSDDSLNEQKNVLEAEIDILKKEYQHFVKLAFTGLVFGIIGVIITGGIFGSKAEQVRKRKNETIEKLHQLNKEIKQQSTISECLQRFHVDLNEIEQYIEDADISVEHLLYMWQTTLTEINASLINFKKINNAMELIRFSIYLEKIIAPWYMVVGYSKEMMAVFDEALSSFYSSK
ncbi:TPA: alpha-xenorhabdolysin family binary toxin subunit A [Proteus mirabilis]|uniref:alpha-xenorhabdolysin family binary toxin subunit A n=1 Tax=Proteus mirabilis TaxID=584 RepID=UPI0018C7452E|nr:alpha-xenorhabdolysin family binary toxin subunit A [Proteus mirabilis]HDT0721122.1 alpha-xenorhabdolysin family binary toxin subunit A [Proteus mirabilis]HEJ9414672.1 alpha-xenorhabdolysin family binary toxin subunit A [Proteus mirabilis]HEJ9659820.1 alpha-xenorhabdolysin family binary toxin subunit A [Proteus mirabilis]HEK1718478.1 alpha-xenorhabdolysin family binary toxin subunit A [Proteus mirabilis]